MKKQNIILLATFALLLSAVPLFAQTSQRDSTITTSLAFDLSDTNVNDELDNAARQLEAYMERHDLLLPKDKTAEIVVLEAVIESYTEIPGEGGEPSSFPAYVDLDLVSRYQTSYGGEPETNFVYISRSEAPAEDVFYTGDGEPSFAQDGLYLGKLRKALENVTVVPVKWAKAKIKSLYHK